MQRWHICWKCVLLLPFLERTTSKWTFFLRFNFLFHCCYHANLKLLFVLSLYKIGTRTFFQRKRRQWECLTSKFAVFCVFLCLRTANILLGKFLLVLRIAQNYLKWEKVNLFWWSFVLLKKKICLIRLILFEFWFYLLECIVSDSMEGLG